jgi:hypothetical protein
VYSEHPKELKFMKTVSLKFILSLLLIVSFSRGYSQYSQIVDKDTSDKIYSKVFDFISSSIDTFTITCFEKVKTNKKRLIYYRQIASSEVTHKLEGTLQYPPYKNIFSQVLIDSAVINITPAKNVTKFVKLLPSMNPKNAQSFMFLHSLLRYDNKIYLKVNSSTPPIRNRENEMRVSTLYFVFNSSLDLIYFQGVDNPYRN